MIYIFTALYLEAKNIIEHYHLSIISSDLKFPVYEGEGLRLVIMGTGNIAAAVAVASVCTHYSISKKDSLINVGICAGSVGKVGDIYLCNKITEEETGRTFYPDMIYQNSLKEMCVTTCAKPKQDAIKEKQMPSLYDMEAAAVYQAGSFFMGPHQMSFLKIVSDFGNTEDVTKDVIEEIMKQSDVIDYIDFLVQHHGKMDNIKLPTQKIQQWKADLKASVVMENALEQLITYCSLAEIDYEDAIKKLYEEEKLPCKSKREGKIYLEELRKQLL